MCGDRSRSVWTRQREPDLEEERSPYEHCYTQPEGFLSMEIAAA
jgi:hypothetical protein